MREVAELAPLTFQQAFALEHWMQGENVFVLTYAVRLRGALDVTSLSRSLSEVVRRHEALRTRIVTVAGELCQKVDVACGWVLEPEVVRGGSAACVEHEAKRIVEKFFCEGVDPRAGPVLGVRLLRLRDEEHVLAVVIHHLFADLAAGALFFEELWALYRDTVQGRAWTLADVSMQYADYAEWQRDAYRQRPQRIESYWAKRLKGAERVRLPVDSGLQDVRPARVGEAHLAFGSSVSARLNELARRERVAPSMVILVLYTALLGHWSRQRNFVVPFEMSGRDYPKHFKVMGYLAHSLPLRMEWGGEETFSELLRRVNGEFMAAYQHLSAGAVPGESRDLMRGALFQWASWVPNGGAAAAAGVGASDGSGCVGIETFPTTGLPPDNFRLPFDLELVFWNDPHGIRGYGWYRADLFRPDTLHRFLCDLRQLAERAVEDPHSRLIPASLR